MTRWAAALAGTLALAFAASSCQSAALPNDWRDLAQQTVMLQVDWQQDLSSANPFSTFDVELGGLAAVESHIVAATAGVGLVALDASTGAIAWQQEDPDEAYSAAPAAAGELVVVPGPDGLLRATRASGAAVWEVDLGTRLHSRPVVDGERVYVSTADADLVALDRTSGRLLWRYDHPASGRMTIVGDGEARSADGSLYVGFSDGSLVKLSEDGEPLWAVDLARGAERLRDVDTRPLVVGGVVVAGSFAGGLHGVDTSSGALLWSLDVDGATSAVRSGPYALTTTADARVVWFDPRTGEEVAALQLGADTAQEAVVAGDLGFVATSAGLFVIDAHQPWVFHRFDPGSPVSVLPLVTADRVIVMSDGGVVSGLSLRRYRR